MKILRKEVCRTERGFHPNEFNVIAYSFICEAKDKGDAGHYGINLLLIFKAQISVRH
jgi:hypothetical protein